MEGGELTLSAFTAGGAVRMQIERPCPLCLMNTIDEKVVTMTFVQFMNMRTTKDDASVNEYVARLFNSYAYYYGHPLEGASRAMESDIEPHFFYHSEIFALMCTNANLSFRDARREATSGLYS